MTNDGSESFFNKFELVVSSFSVIDNNCDCLSLIGLEASLLSDIDSFIAGWIVCFFGNAKGGNSWKGSPLSVVLIAKRSLLCFSGLVAKKVPHDGVSIISCLLRVAFGGRRSFRSRGRIEGTSIVSSVWSGVR